MHFSAAQRNRHARRHRRGLKPTEGLRPAMENGDPRRNRRGVYIVELNGELSESDRTPRVMRHAQVEPPSQGIRVRLDDS